ncbi:MAG: SH3 domain-containing protein [Chloroflexota bacterium]
MVTDRPFIETTYLRLFVLLSILIGSSGCGSLFGPEQPNEPPPTRAAAPTFTPTDIPIPQAELSEDSPIITESDTGPSNSNESSETEANEGESAGVKTVGALLQSASPTSGAEDESANESLPNADQPVTDNSSVESSTLAAELSTEPSAVVIGEIVNVRRGPSTAYDIVGSATANEQFPLMGRNELGDWWQVCCFSGEEPGWLYGPLVQTQNAESVPVAANIPPPPTPVPTAIPVAAEPTPPPIEEAVTEEPTTAPPSPAVITDSGGTAGNFDPNAQFHIVHYHVRGFDENNGGIFNNGGQHMVFITVLDENGNGIDGAVVKDVLADSFNVVTGNKGPGRTEFEMFWEPYKLTVASIPSGPVTSQISNQMNTAKPHIPDIIGKLGPADHEYAICPTPDDRCEPPFFHAHWSYEITFQKVK